MSSIQLANPLLAGASASTVKAAAATPANSGIAPIPQSVPPTTQATAQSSTLTAPPQDGMKEMMCMMLSMMKMMLDVLAGGTPSTPTPATTGAAATAAPKVALSSAQQLQQDLKQLNTQNPGLNPQTAAQLLNSKYSNTQFIPTANGSLQYALNGKNFTVAPSGATPPQAI